MSTEAPKPSPLHTDSPLPPLLAIFGAMLMAIGSVCPWSRMVTDNDMDTEIYPAIRIVLIAASIGYLGVAAATTAPGPRRTLLAVVLGLGSFGALLGCLAFIAIGQTGYYHDSDDVDCALKSGSYSDCDDPALTLYDPNIGIALIVLGSLITGAVALWLIVGWAAATLRLINLSAAETSPPLQADPLSSRVIQDIRHRNDLSTAALAVSLSSVLLCGATGLVGAVLGHVAQRQARSNGENGIGAAIAAIIIGWLFFAGFLAIISQFLIMPAD